MLDLPPRHACTAATYCSNLVAADCWIADCLVIMSAESGHLKARIPPLNLPRLACNRYCLQQVLFALSFSILLHIAAMLTFHATATAVTLTENTSRLNHNINDVFIRTCDLHKARGFRRIPTSSLRCALHLASLVTCSWRTKLPASATDTRNTTRLHLLGFHGDVTFV